MPRRIRVLIVDDSASVRQALPTILSEDPIFEILDPASDPFVAARRLQTQVPDVITLDVEMPRMDGVTFLRKLMLQHPIPVVMCSSLTEQGSETLMQALAAGAVDVILKPKLDAAQSLMDAKLRICDVVRAAAHARIRPLSASGRKEPQEKLSADAMLPPPGPTQAMARTTETVVCIGASTGGTESLREVLEALPIASPGICIVQHMPEKFTEAFARRLNRLCALEVKEAADGDAVLRGRVLIAPGNRHMLLMRSGARYHVEVRDGPLVTRHRPSVDVLFRSAARGRCQRARRDHDRNGRRRRRQLLEMRNAGAQTVAQDEASSVVFGMPKEAIALGAAGKVLPLGHLAAEIARAGRV